VKAAPEGQAALFVARTNGEAVLGYDAPPPAPDPIRMARRGDPSSSHEAAELAVASGAVATHGEAVLAALRRRPWATSLELFVLDDELRRQLRSDRAEVNRRLDTLLKERRIVRMRPDDNPTLRPCASMCEAVKRRRLTRWAVLADLPRAAEFVAPGAVPIIDRGTGAPAPLTGDRAA